MVHREGHSLTQEIQTVKTDIDTARKVSVFGDFLVDIFPHSDWIRKDTPSVWMWENTDQKNFVIL